MKPHRIAIIGFGKIAQDQHNPVIAADPDFELVAIASQSGSGPSNVPAFRDHREMLAKIPDLDAVAICTPPQVRHGIARDALAAGVNVLLEKPPAATLSELVDLERLAAQKGKVLMTTWHSQYNAGVDEAKRRLAGEQVTKLFVNWKEDVRKWHPGQAWIWQAGGFGIFDPGVNALSIVTKIMPEPLFVRQAELLFPKGAQAPIAANLDFSRTGEAESLRAEFDWRPIGHDNWEITVETAAGATLDLTAGGSRLAVDGKIVTEAEREEYQGIYKHFDKLLTAGQSYVDAAPFRLVADAFMIGKRTEVEAFKET